MNHSTPTTTPGRWRRAVRAVTTTPPLAIGASMFLFFVVLAVFAPVLTPYEPNAIDPANAFSPPTPAHWFGTDELGRDLLTRTLFGARVSLATCVTVGLFASVVGVAIGICSGYARGWVDAVIMRIIDVQLSIPAILMAMLVVVVMGRGFLSTVIAVSIASVPAFARIARASTLGLLKQEYVTAVRSMGGGHFYTMFVSILPNAMGPILVQLVITGSVAILLEAGLSFLGLGIQPPDPSLGEMLRAGKGFLANAPYYAVLPGLFLVLIVLALELSGRGMQSVFRGNVEVRR